MAASARILLGLDVGGSSVKGGLVDVASGRLSGELVTVPTPRPAIPQAVIQTITALAQQLSAQGPVGFALPSVITRGVVRTAAHIDASWLGANAVQLLHESLGRPVVCLNDADAAGIAEMSCGAGRDTPGTVVMLTFGTGIGSAVFRDGRLVPNTEFGHLELHGGDAEEWASARIRTQLGLDFAAWIPRVNEYLARLHALLWPDVYILGGAVSEHFDQFSKLLQSRAEIRPAQFAGQSGVIGAALAAAGRCL